MINHDRFKKALRKRGLRQADLVRLTGTTEAAISRYANGQRMPKHEILVSLCSILETSPEWLCGIDGMMDPQEAYQEAMGMIMSYGGEWTDQQKARMIRTVAGYFRDDAKEALDGEAF